jgi:hypothetical protein
MPRKLLAFVLTVVLSSTVALAMQSAFAGAQDVSGVWSGSIAIPEQGKRVKSPLHASFKQEGADLTGTLGPQPNAQLPITKGRVESTKFGTVITFDMPGQGFVMHFELRPDGEWLRGLARLDGEKAPAPVELQSTKPSK